MLCHALLCHAMPCDAVSEVVIFGPSFERPRGVRLTHDPLCVLLDEQRLLRATVP